MDRFFFFGTLMDRDVLELVLDRTVVAEDLVAARLDGFSRRRIKKDSFPVLTLDPGHSVEGLVFTPRDQSDHDRILFFEDFDYDLAPCRPVLTEGAEIGVEIEALYCGASEASDAADEFWDLSSWAARHKAAFLTISKIYMDCHGRMTPEEAEEVWQSARRIHQPHATH